MVIWLAGNVPSSKNSKVKTSRGVFHSKTVVKYLRALGIKGYSVSKKQVYNYVTRENKFDALREDFTLALKDKEYPIKVGFHFVRNSKRQFDFHNAVQIVADLMVAHGYIEDDNMDCFLPIPFKRKGRWYTVDKDNPGVYIKIY